MSSDEGDDNGFKSDEEIGLTSMSDAIALTERRAAGGSGGATVTAIDNFVWFHCLIDPRLIRPHERVGLRGDLPCMGEWDNEIPMARSPFNPNIWSCRIELPFRVAGARPRDFRNPYFNFKYSIEGVTDGPEAVLLEGLNNRSETKLQRHFYHSFRQDYRDKDRRYIGQSEVDDFVDFTNNELQRALNEEVSPEEFLVRFEYIATSCSGRREEVEDIFDNYVEHGIPTGDNITLLMLLLGTMGHFGLSSKDPLQMTRVNMPGVSATAPLGYKYTYHRKELAERPWSRFVLGNLPVEAACQTSIYTVFGSRGSWTVRGVAEAVERAANAGGFSWLRVMPFLDKHHSKPTIPFAKLREGFSDVAQQIRHLATRQLQSGLLELAARPPLAEGEKPLPEPYAITMARSWFESVIKYAPSMEDLVDLFDEDFRANAEMLVGGMASKVQSFGFRKTVEFEQLFGLISSIPCFCCPAMAAAIFRNDDGDNFKAQVLRLAALCTSTDLTTPGPEGEEPPEHLKDLAEAAKEWFRRSHAHEPEKPHFSTGYGKGVAPYPTYIPGQGYVQVQKKGPTEAELAAERIGAMVAGIEAADSLLRIAYFGAQREQATLFELGRCHFFKGDSKDVLGALLSVLGENVVEKYVHPTVMWLGLKAKVLVEETVMGDDISSREVLRMLTVITSSLRRGHPLSFGLLHALVLSISTPSRENPQLPPSLSSVLQWNLVWRQVFAYCVPDMANWTPDANPLGHLLQAVHALITQTAVDLQSGVIRLSALHTVLKEQESFVELCVQLRITTVTGRTLEMCRRPLAEFDSTLEKVQNFVSFFCGSSTIRINDTRLRELVTNLTSGYESLTLRELQQGMFVNVECLEDIPWLYNLRQSELFFALWRQTGKKMARELWIKKNTQSYDADIMPGLGEGLFAELPPPEVTDHEVRPPADFVEPSDADLETVVLEMAEVHSALVPTVRESWTQLTVSVRDRSISIQRLSETFATLQSKESVAAEIMVLAQTGAGSTAISVDTTWVPGVHALLLDYHLLNQLVKYIPATLSLAAQMKTLLKTEADVAKDAFLGTLTVALNSINAQWEAQTLATLSMLVVPVKPLFEGLSSELLNFITVMADYPNLVKWLIEHDQTDEFNKLLQVCRPCTDEPVLISAIASLVHVRTILVPLLYVHGPYANMQALLEQFLKVEFEGKVAIRHLSNVAQNFEGLLDVFEKQTRSPGIISCYELKAIGERGVMVFVVGDDEASVLSLELSGETSDGRTKVEPLEYLLDLRSKLLMTEIPEELNAEFPVTALLASFVDQLQVLVEMRDELYDLYTSGHFNYRAGLSRRYPFAMGGLPVLSAALAELRREKAEWMAVVKAAREEFYYLNFLTMRELQRLNEAFLHSGRYASGDGSAADIVAATPKSATGNEAFPADALVTWECEFCGKENPAKRRMCEMCSKPRREAGGSAVAVAAATVAGGGSSSSSQAKEKEEADEAAAKVKAKEAKARRRARRAAANRVKPNPEKDATALLHLVSSSLPDNAYATAAEMFALARGDAATRTPAEILRDLGSALHAVFVALLEKEGPVYREIPLPARTATHRADLLVSIDAEAQKGDKSIPVFVCNTDEPRMVIDVVLSVYVRRGRLPEPGEILFCTASTTTEEIELLIRRFVAGKLHGYKDSVFCLADVHNLSYAQQCLVVDRLRRNLTEYGTASAATLLMVSGRPGQVLLNSLSSQYMDLPPLEERELQKACMKAFELHRYETLAVSSEINGGGKTHYILNYVSERQHGAQPALLYRRLPFRESSSANSIMELLQLYGKDDAPVAFHIDIGHIIPAVANTVLFELLIVGTLRDPGTAGVYHRRHEDLFLIEIPNSIGNRTGKALRLCTFIPAKRLKVESIDLRKPIFTNDECTKISRCEFTELIETCKYLRAYSSGKLKSGDDLDPEWNVMSDYEITAEECYNILIAFTCKDGFSPSYLVFNNFVLFMAQQFANMSAYPIFEMVILMNTEGLADFKQVFMTLLIEVSKDFSLRSVPQIANIGFAATDIFVPTPSAASGSMDFPAITAGEGGSASGSSSSSSSGDKKSIAAQAAAAATAKKAGKEAAAPGFRAPPLKRQRSAASYAAAANAGRPLRDFMDDDIIDMTSDTVARFESMSLWEASDHPIVLFYQNQGGTSISGVDMISTNPRYTDDYIEGNMKAVLVANGIDFNKDWKDLTNDSAIEILLKVNGFMGTSMQKVEPSYVITVDNLLKMLSIMMRMKYGLPVVISGETGCGKSSLINTVCAVIGAELRTLNIHGGMNDNNIREWMYDCIDEAERMKDHTDQLVVFFDEVNTCNSMGLFKEMVCDGTLDGKPLHSKIKIIAACNPYRLKKETNREADASAGLVFEHHTGVSPNEENIGTGIHDPLRNLVYRVHPLPESMTDLVFDFGALTADTERLYIKAVLLRNVGVYIPPELRRLTKNEQMAQEVEATIRAQLGQPATMEDNLRAFQVPKLTPFGEFVEVFAELICASQEFVRALHGGERATVSLRDVARCIKVYRWFGEFYAKSAKGWSIEDFFSVKPAAQEYVRRAVILSLAYCYQARLSREERFQYRTCLANTWNELQKASPYERSAVHWWARLQKARCPWLRLDAQSFTTIVLEAQRSFVAHMNVGEGIALNEALCENLFMILISVLNQIPIFVIGKPGSSKSLAMELVQSNLNGDASENEFLRSLPAVEVFSYQCSPLSTSEGIESAFEMARRYKATSSNTVVVVLLDEVGLAEQSPHLPLKVLHKVLDEGGAGESLVGISNWALDPAKMNRAVHLYRPAPTVEDLSVTAEGMVKSVSLKGYLQSLAKAYSEVYHGQEHGDFWGLREFYSTVRFINRALTASNTLTSDMLMTAVMRNFGGRPQEIKKVLSTFFGNMGLVQPSVSPSVVELVRQNIAQVEARHLMLLTKNNAALGLLFDKGLLEIERTEVIFGSDFPLDQTDLQVCLNIQRVKLCMAEGVTIVLVHCESLYESLYDLLNQHYCEYGGQLYVRLAFGTHSRLCPIHRSFRVVVVVDKVEAYTRLAPPLLNRFEKQVMERQHMTNPIQRRLAARLHNFACTFANSALALTHDDSDGEVKQQQDELKTPLAVLRSSFCGYHSDILSSLVLAVVPEDRADIEAEEMDALFHECARQLIWIAAPEAAVKVLNTPHGRALIEKHRVDAGTIYFKEQLHSSLPLFMDTMLPSLRDPLGSQLVVMTYAPLALNAVEVICKQSQWTDVTHTALHELSSERDLIQKVKDFFEAAKDGSVLFVQCDPLASSLRRIEHAKYICENARARNYARLVDGVIEKYDPIAAKAAAAAAGGGEGGAATTPAAAAAAPAPAAGGAASSSGSVAPKGVHVVFLIHLPRSHHLAFAFDFDKRWRNVFVDSIEPAAFTGMPDVDTLIGKSFTDIMASLNLKLVLAHNFRLALSRLVYSYERTNEDVRAQILTLLSHFEDADFMAVVQETINHIVEDTKMEINLTSSAQDERELSLAGTFRAAMHRQIVEVAAGMFAIVLGHMDRDANLQLYRDPALRSLWLHLFHRSFQDMSVLQMSKVTANLGRGGRNIESTIEVRADGHKGVAFAARFPFSFFVSKMLESMRDVAENTGTNAVDSLIQQFTLLAPGHGLEGPQSPESMAAYVHDFACMHARNSSVLDKSSQARILLHMLGMVGEGKLDLLARVHARFWSYEKVIDAYFGLVDAVPAIKSDVLSLIMSMDSLGASMHLGVISIVLSSLAAAQALWKGQDDYAGWMSQVELAKNTLTSLLSWSRDEALATNNANLLTETARVQDAFTHTLFRYTFVRDVAVTLNIPPELSLETFKAALGSSTTSLTSLATYQSLVQALSELCRRWMPLGALPAYSSTYSVPTTLPRFWGAAGRFLEGYFFDHVFAGGSSAEVPLDLLAAFVSLLSGRVPTYVDADQGKQFIATVPSEAGKVALLRCLVGLRSPSVAAGVANLIKDELIRGVVEEGHLDTKLCTLWMTVYEESISSETFSVDAAIAAVAATSQALLIGATAPDGDLKGLDVIGALQAVASMRRVLGVFAHGLCAQLDSGSPTAAKVTGLERLADLQAALEPVLSVPAVTATALTHSIQRSMRMFLLKTLERQRGVGFVRSALQQAPLSTSGWLAQWKESGETGLVRFLGTNRLPRDNPFLTLPFYRELSALVAGYLNTGSLTELDAVVAARASDFKVRGTLIGVFFNELFLLSVLPDYARGPLPAKVAALKEWVRSSASLSPFTAVEREVLDLVVGRVPEAAGLGKGKGESESRAASTAVDAHALGDFFSATPDSSPEHILVLRVMAHTAAMAVAAGTGDLGSFFRMALLNPAGLVGQFLPTMPEDIQFLVQNALGGRWYKCPNGHSYYVDACGRPTEILKCATCGEEIGGTDHNLLQSNIDTNSVGTELYQKTVFEDTTSPNYCLRDARVEAEDPYFAVRLLNASSVRVIRLVMHAAFFLSSYVGGPTWAKAIDVIFNRTYCNPTDVPPFFLAHFESDWAQLKKMVGRSDDDLAVLIHDLLNAVAADTRTVAPLKTPADRGEWEKAIFTEHILNRMDTDGMGDRLLTIYAKYTSSTDDEGNMFTSELLEMFDANTMPVAVRRVSVPTLWIYRRPFSLESFTLQLNLKSENTELHPVLTEFLSQESQLRALRYLPGLLTFPELLTQRYNRRIDLETARKLTLAEVMADVPESDTSRWTSAYEDFANAWNLSWRSVERFGCLRIPPTFVNMKIDSTTPLSFCLITDLDEGICPLALVRFLVEKHNMFVDRVDELLLLRGRDMQRSSARQAVVQSRFMTSAHTLSYDLEGGFLPYAEKQCVQYSASGDLMYDFVNAEKFLLDRYFTGKPLVELSIKMFEYISEGTAIQHIVSLRQKMEQAPLKADVAAVIAAEISSPAVASQYIELLETVVSFLLATGGSFVQRLDETVANLLLDDYTENVLLIKDAAWGRAVKENVRLKHLHAFWTLLQDSTNADPFDKVQLVYKSDLTPELEQIIRNCAKFLELPVLLPTLKETIVSQMDKDNLSTRSPLKDCVGWAVVDDEFMNSFDWFKEFFPVDIPCSNAVATFKLLEKLAV